MATTVNNRRTVARPISNLRWWIGGLLFASTVINYLDRQTLSVLAPYLKTQYKWNNEDFALIVIAFRVAYSVGQTLAGRLIDRIGTRKGLTIPVIWSSIAAMLPSLAGGLRTFAFFRFLLGAAEPANWPAATKAVAEWFPKRERGWAVALFDSGSSIGGAIAPILVIGLYKYFGGWRPAFIITGTLGFLWLIAWRILYHPPESHPRIGAAERAMILRDRIELNEQDQQSREQSRWRDLIKLPQTWAIIAARTITDPGWVFITHLFSLFFVCKGI